MSKMLEFRNKIRFVNFNEISTNIQSSNIFYPKAYQTFPTTAQGTKKKQVVLVSEPCLQSMFYHAEQWARVLTQTSNSYRVTKSVLFKERKKCLQKLPPHPCADTTEDT